MSEVKNGWVIKTFVGFLATSLWGALIMVISFTGNIVKANDVKNSDEHTEIRDEIVVRYEQATDKIDTVKNDIANMKIELARKLGEILIEVKK